MRKSFFFILMTSAILLGLSGCKMSPERALTQEANKVETVPAETVVEPVVTASEGDLWSAKLKSQRPFAVMLDNHAGARPQAGLKDAEIVIEALAEGNITRYMAFFFEGMPESVGPIRSARPYFLDRAMEYDAVYVHVGGSPKALSDIRQLRIADLDGLSASNKVFFRKKHKKIPHNMYSTMAILRSEAQRRKFTNDSIVTASVFANEDTTPIGEASLYVKMPYRKNDGGYMVSYNYLADSKVYQRSINGVVHLDEIDKSSITTKNLLIQYVQTNVVDDAGRLDLDLVGSGDAWWLTDGVKTAIKWEKSSRESKTNYTTLDGREILLNPGNTWIQIVPKNMTIQWEKI